MTENESLGAELPAEPLTVSVVSLHSLLRSDEALGSLLWSGASGQEPGETRRGAAVTIPLGGLRILPMPRGGHSKASQEQWDRQYGELERNDLESPESPPTVAYSLPPGASGSQESLTVCMLHTPDSGWQLCMAASLTNPTIDRVVLVQKLLFDPEVGLLTMSEARPETPETRPPRARSLLEIARQCLSEEPDVGAIAMNPVVAAIPQLLASGNGLSRVGLDEYRAAALAIQEWSANDQETQTQSRSLPGHFPLQMVWWPAEIRSASPSGIEPCGMAGGPPTPKDVLIDSLIRKEPPGDTPDRKSSRIAKPPMKVDVSPSDSWFAETYLGGHEVIVLPTAGGEDYGEAGPVWSLMNATCRVISSRDQAQSYSRFLNATADRIAMHLQGSAYMRLVGSVDPSLNSKSNANHEEFAELRAEVASRITAVSFVRYDLESRLAPVLDGKEQKRRFGEILVDYSKALGETCNLPEVISTCRDSLGPLENLLDRTRAVLDFKAQSALMVDSRNQLARLGNIMRGNDTVRLVVIVFAMIATAISVGELWISVNSMPRANDTDFVAPDLSMGAALSLAVLGLGALLGTLAWKGSSRGGEKSDDTSGKKRGSRFGIKTDGFPTIAFSIASAVGMSLLASVVFVANDKLVQIELSPPVIPTIPGVMFPWLMIALATVLGLVALFLIAREVRSSSD